ncbi:hypothetical protein [Streptomyces collinus]|uniref:hypothetical protein n=1 Tax=Streptomyces collinus TaxID=42684 RepID=UPI00368FF070
MTPNMPQPTSSAAAHAERIRAREQAATERKAAPTGGQSTAERYAAQVLPGYHADEELREQARLNEMRARGRWVPGDQDDDTEEAEEQEQPAAAVDPTDNPERRSARAAHRGAVAHAYQQAQQEGRGFLAL